MDIKPVDFLLAKSAVDYFIKVFKLDLSDEQYKFHMYNLATLMEGWTGMPEEVQKIMAERDGFLEEMQSFKNRYWEMMEMIQTNNK